MSLWSYFGFGGPLSERRVAKSSKLAANAFAQPEVRMRELTRLLNDGSPHALRGVLKRFAVNAQGHIADEEEKSYLSQALIDKGTMALAPLEDYIRSEAKLTWALLTYRRIAQSTAATRLFIQVLHDIGPHDHRRIEAKEQLVRELGEHLDEPEVLDALAPFLLDHADEVRAMVLELVTSATAPAGSAAPGAPSAGGSAADGAAFVGKAPAKVTDKTQSALADALAKLVIEPDVSLRVAQRAAQLLAERKWQLPAEPRPLNPMLEDGYFLDGRRQLHVRAAG